MRTHGPFVLAAALLLAACGGGAEDPDGGDPATTSEPVPFRKDLGPPLELSVTAEKSTVTIGDDIVFRVEITNRGESTKTVNVPRIGTKSLRFRVRRGADVIPLQRHYFEIDAQGKPQWLPNAVTELDPGDSVQQEIRTPALGVGTTEFTPNYAWRGGEPLVGRPVQVEVTPNGDRATLGVVMETSKGEMTFRLRPEYAYTTVESFVSLARKGFFDGTKFHRIVRGFMAQGGDPKGTGEGGPGYFLPGEMHKHLLHDRGVLSMARTGLPTIGKDTAGSQFFILFARRPDLDPVGPGREGYTTFGEMLKGDETLQALEAVEVRPNERDPRRERSVPVETITLEKVRIIALP